MRQVEVYRAQGAEGDGVVPVVIYIQRPMPDIASETSRAFFASEGAALAEAIWSSCPGGTVDAMTAALLARRASLLRVPFTSQENTNA